MTICKIGQVTAAIFLLIRCYQVYCDNYLRSSYIQKLNSCSLAGSVNEAVVKSEVLCKTSCVGLEHQGGCAVFQWHAENSTCHTQQELNVAASDGDAVGVLMTGEPNSCTDDSGCPENHRCIKRGCVELNPCIDASDCSEILAADPTRQSGVYNILVGTQHIQVWCDMDTDGGGWTVFLKRFDGGLDFYQNYATYTQGFGDVSGEYWLALNFLHALTTSKAYQLRVDLSDWEGASAHSLFASITVDDANSHFKLTLGEFLGGEGGDALRTNDGMKFSAKDADRDKSANHCARKFRGGFWYQFCMVGNPTGRYYIGGSYTNTNWDGMQWRTWPAHDDKYYSMKTMEMKIRPWHHTS